MMKLLLLLAVVMTTVVMTSRNHADNIPAMYRSAMAKYRHGGYARLMQAEENPALTRERMNNFRESVRMVEAINDDPSKGYTAALNFLSVMTREERDSLLNLGKLNITAAEEGEVVLTRRNHDNHDHEEELPSHMDWVSRGAQPDVKYQGECGSCGMFSAASSLEAEYFIVTGKLVPFAEQEYLDCLMEWMDRGDTGCTGVWMSWALNYNQYVERMGAESSLPYVGIDRQCSVDDVPNALVEAEVTAVDMSMRGSDEALLRAAAHHVVAVAIRTVPQWEVYREGIFECSGDCACTGHINHAVTIVGYAPEYWNIRNSWGSWFGDGGYIKMTRAQDNICSINTWATLPVVTCKEGVACTGWNEDEYDGDGQEEKEDEERDIGEDVMCGEIQHFGGLCVDMDDTAAQNAVLTSAGCSREFCLTDMGFIRDTPSGKCLTADGTSNNTEIRFGSCNSASTAQWELSEFGFRVASTEDVCWHPLDGSPDPIEDTKLVVHTTCNEERLTFKIKENMCWKEKSGMKFTERLEVEGNFVKFNKKQVEEAKEACLITDGCQGVYLRKKKLFLAAGQVVESKKKDMVFVLEACNHDNDVLME